MIRIILYWIDTHRWFITAILSCVVLANVPTPEGLSENGMDVIAILVMSTIILITAQVPLPTVPLLIAVFQVLLDVNTPKGVSQSFMSDSVFFIMGSLMLAVAIVHQKLDRRIAYWILHFAKGSITRLSTGFILVCAIMASFIGGLTVAAIMLPVAITIVINIDENQKNIRNITLMLMFSIAYGCAIASIGTPSGGARNAVMIDYWSRLYDIKISYFEWIKYAYPMVLIQIPVVAILLRITFKPEKINIGNALDKLRESVKAEGKMNYADWLTVSIFLFILFLWVTSSDTLGLGIPAFIGVSAYLAFGLISWEEINRGVNWGVVLLYGSAISLGIAMQNTGAASWIANALLSGFTSLHLGGGLLLMVIMAVITMLVANIMSNGPAVAVLGPIFLEVAVLSDMSVILVGFIIAMASSFTYMTVIGSPANTIVYGSNFIKPKDFFKAGWKMSIASIIILTLISATYWQFLQ